ncbi:unnamed protein product [Lactuca saligna]|uniref:Uncharacterized protein n=1 Tax=Lactuca saligna TaxID=75948 RepID=A0AA35YK69_LACSI|nr:unnamed protein product [Lactuca saligna]
MISSSTNSCFGIVSNSSPTLIPKGDELCFTSSTILESCFTNFIVSDLELCFTVLLGVVVKLMEKSRLVLKFIWMEKNIGLALDQVIPVYESFPLSPYYFLPREDTWEELKVMLESKPWIS